MMENLANVLDQQWTAFHGPNAINTVRYRTIPNPGLPDYVLFQTSQRLEYNRHANQLREIPSAHCPLCSEHVGVLFEQYLFINPDKTPFASFHSLLRFFRDPVSRHAGGKFSYHRSRKREHAHRDYPLKEDIDSCVSLASETGYLVCQSLRGSGASLPNHVHAHAFKRNGEEMGLLRLPHLAQLPVRRIGETHGMTVSRLGTPAFGTLLQGDRMRFGEQIMKTFALTGVSFNLVVGVDDPFPGAWVLVFWRAGEYPADPIFVDNDSRQWHFGFSEMLGLFEVKSDAQYEQLDACRLTQALKTATIGNESLRCRIEGSLLDIC